VGVGPENITGGALRVSAVRGGQRHTLFYYLH